MATKTTILSSETNDAKDMLTIVKNTPFAVVKQGTKYYIVCGNGVVSKKVFDTKEQAIKYVNTKPWELIINAAVYVINYNSNLKQKQDGQNQTNESADGNA